MTHWRAPLIVAIDLAISAFVQRLVVWVVALYPSCPYLLAVLVIAGIPEQIG
jgi:hypothetical protein